MKKIIKVDIANKEEIYEKYKKDKISKELIDYITNLVSPYSKKEKVKIIINNGVKEKEIIPKIKERFKEEYNKLELEYHHNSIRQIIYLWIGIIMIFLSMIIDKNTIFNELFLISGWVLIWEMIEIEMVSDLDNIKRRKILKKLLVCEITEIK